MTRADDAITLQGVSAAITRRSEGTANGYGDPAETWSTIATEKVIIQLAGKSMSERATLAGEVDEAAYVGLFLITSVVAIRDVLVVGSAKYEVQDPLSTKTVYGSASHKEAPLRLLQEG